MKRFTGLFTIAIAVFAALAFAPAAFAQESTTDEDGTYVPRAERDTGAVMTFVGSAKELKIVDNRTGETTYYSTRNENRIRRLSEEASARANERWEQRQAAAEEAAAAQAAAEAEEADAGSDDSEAATEGSEDAEG